MRLTDGEHELLVKWHEFGHVLKLGPSRVMIKYIGKDEYYFFLIKQLFKSKQGVELRIATPSKEMLVDFGANPSSLISFLFGELFPMLRKPLGEQIYVEPQILKEITRKPVVKMEVPIYQPTDRRKYPT